MSHEQDDKRPDRRVTIIVNGRPTKADASELSFEQLVALAFESAPTGPNILITITYRNGPRGNESGSLVPGQSVSLKDGMKFVVVATDKS